MLKRVAAWVLLAGFVLLLVNIIVIHVQLTLSIMIYIAIAVVFIFANSRNSVNRRNDRKE